MAAMLAAAALAMLWWRLEPQVSVAGLRLASTVGTEETWSSAYSDRSRSTPTTSGLHQAETLRELGVTLSALGLPEEHERSGGGPSPCSSACRPPTPRTSRALLAGPGAPSAGA
jgi:hypothetical protein